MKMIYRIIDQARQEIKEKLTEKLGKVSVNPEPVAHLTLRGRTVLDLSEEEKIQCARDYFLTGNLSAIARERGIFYNDLLELARGALWQEEVQNLEREANAQLKVRMSQILGKALGALEDRLENGDMKLTASGETRLIPVSARDLATISNVVFDKKKMLEDAEKGFGSNEARRLISLAEALRSRGLEAKPVEQIAICEVIDNETGA